MDLAAVPIVGVVVGLTGREVERAGNFFVEENVAHRMKHERIEPERELADVTRARIGIEDFVQLLRIVAGCLLDFPVLELEADTVEAGPLINCWRIKENVALDRLLHRAAKNLTIRDIAIASANHGADSFDGEG